MRNGDVNGLNVHDKDVAIGPNELEVVEVDRVCQCPGFTWEGTAQGGTKIALRYLEISLVRHWCKARLWLIVSNRI